MPRNNRIRKHSHIPSGKKGCKRLSASDRLNGYKTIAKIESKRNGHIAVYLNFCLLTLPWAALFAGGVLV